MFIFYKKIFLVLISTALLWQAGGFCADLAMAQTNKHDLNSDVSMHHMMHNNYSDDGFKIDREDANHPTNIPICCYGMNSKQDLLLNYYEKSEFFSIFYIFNNDCEVGDLARVIKPVNNSPPVQNLQIIDHKIINKQE